MLAVARPHQHNRIGVHAPDQARGAHVRVRVVQGHHVYADVFATGGAQHLRPGRVAVIQLVAEPAQVRDRVRVGLQRHERNLLRGQQACHHLAEAAHAGDHHLRLDAAGVHRVGRRCAGLGSVLAAEQAQQRDHQQRGDRHRQAHDRHQPVVVGAAQQVRALGLVEHHEGEFTAQPQHAAQHHRVPGAQLGQLADAEQQPELHHQQDRHAGGNHRRLGHDPVQVDAHAHRDEEQAQQQALERFDLRFQLVPEFRIGQQHPGQERAQARTQPGFLHEPRRAQHHQQRHRGEHLGAARARDDVEQPAQHRPPAQDHHRQRAQRHGHVAPLQGLVLGAAQQWDRGQQRNGDQVLEQQDGKAQPPVIAVDRLVLGQQLQAHRGGRQRQRQAHDQRALPLEVVQQQQAAQHHRTQRHLQRAGPEHRAPHHLEPGRGQLQPDHEQQHHHADLGRAEDAVGILHKAHAVRAQHHAGSQVAQHRAEAELLEHRYGDHRGQQQHQGQLEGAAVHGRSCAGNVRPLCVAGVRPTSIAAQRPARAWVDRPRAPVQTARRCRPIRQYTLAESPNRCPATVEVDLARRQ
ncbi:hypothetical protein D3C71_1149310 [compost metagenome]